MTKSAGVEPSGNGRGGVKSMLPAILFVDDEEKVLDALRRNLQPKMHRQWAIEFASSGEESLRILTKFPCDVVVTDMQMPGMNGAELLDIVEMTYPDIIRIVLSGNYDASSTFRLVRGEHQFLAKPCNSGLLIGTINASLKMREMMVGDRRRDKAQGVVDAINNLTDVLRSTGMATQIEVPEDVNMVITESGLQAFRSVVGDQSDLEAAQEFDAFLSDVSAHKSTD